MTTKTELPEDFAVNLNQMAEANNARMDGTTKPVFEILDDAAVAFGVWDDPATPRGFDLHVIKGHELLQKCIATGEAAKASVTAIKCISPEQAAALETVYAKREHGKGH